MESLRLIEFLSEEANSLLRRSRSVDGPEARAQLDEAAELLALSASLMKRYSEQFKTEDMRSAA